MEYFGDHPDCGGWVPTNTRNTLIGMERYPDKVQSNAVRFEGGSWLAFGKSSEWSFNDCRAVLNDGNVELSYRLVERGGHE